MLNIAQAPKVLNYLHKERPWAWKQTFPSRLSPDQPRGSVWRSLVAWFTKDIPLSCIPVALPRPERLWQQNWDTPPIFRPIYPRRSIGSGSYAKPQACGDGWTYLSTTPGS